MPNTIGPAAPPESLPLISVVVPAWNRREDLRRCLASLELQTYRSFEVIVVDDGSTDGTGELPREFESTSSLRSEPSGPCARRLQLSVVRNAKRMGANPSRNIGIARARGAYIAFIDSDAVAEPSWLETLVTGFHDETVGGVVGLVRDRKPTNVFEFALFGMSRLTPGSVRIVASNLCLRTQILNQFPLDEAIQRPDFSKRALTERCEEEPIRTVLDAAGYRLIFSPEAVVVHHHPWSALSFAQLAWINGVSAARLVFRYRLWPRLDVMLHLTMLLTVPLLFRSPPERLVALTSLTLAVCATLFNEVRRKGRTTLEGLLSLPLMMLYFQTKSIAYATHTLGLVLRVIPLRRISVS